MMVDGDLNKVILGMGKKGDVFLVGGFSAHVPVPGHSNRKTFPQRHLLLAASHFISHLYLNMKSSRIINPNKHNPNAPKMKKIKQ